MDMFGRHENKILGLIEVGPVRSKLVFENENGDKYIKYFENTLISGLDKENCTICFGRHNDFLSGLYEEHNHNINMASLFSDNGELKKDLFGLIEVTIIEMNKGYKKNTVFFGICKDNNENYIVINYVNRNKRIISIGDIIQISPLELIESEAYNKNDELLRIYHRINKNRKNGT